MKNAMNGHSPHEALPMTRRTFISSSATAAAGAALTGARAGAGAPPPPNFLIIVCDQMVLDAISAYRDAFTHPAYACHWVDTPNLDDLVRNGVSFLESHSTNPVCCPARSSLFTGRMPVETGLIVNNTGIDRDVPNMGQWFERDGRYDRVYCGKWHAGGQWNVPDVTGPRKIPGFDTLPNGPGNWGRNMDYAVSSSVEAFIRNRSRERPFIVVAGLMDPHDICFWGPSAIGRGRPRGTDFFGLGDNLPTLPPNQDYDFPEPWGGGVAPNVFSDMHWRNYIYDYCRMVERLDRNVGRMLRAVRDTGDDTIVVFTADHGDGLGRHRRLQKWHPYEESVKVPFIVYGPRFGIRRNVVDAEHLISGVDLMSTVCDYAGVTPPPNVRGLSLRPLLEGRDAEWRDDLYYELRLTGRGIRTARFKYAVNYVQSAPKQRPTPEAVFVTEDGTPSEFLTGEGRRFRRHEGRLLFDMEADPWETRNLALDPAFEDVMREHDRILREQWEAILLPGHAFKRG
jgi:arylsulfatase A-like enzyme